MHSVFRFAAILRCLLPLTALAMVSAGAPVNARTANCDAAAQQQQRARARVGASRGMPATARNAEQTSTGQLAKRLQRQIEVGALPPSTALLFYTRGADGSLTMCLVNPTGLVASELSATDESSLLKSVQALRWAYGVEELQQVRAARRSAEPVQPPPDVLLSPGMAETNLTGMLLPPSIASTLAGIEHLIIVPAGSIGTVPFPALKPFGNNDALVDRTSITIAPSLAEFENSGSKWAAAAAFARPLVVGDPSLPVSDEWVIPPLPGARAEAKDVAKLLNSRGLSGDKALRSAVVQRALEASVIYVAAHGSSDPARPLDGGFLMLSGPTLESGWWTAREIQTSRLPAELAVLSACQTGLGQVHDGGMIGLARAFQLAGTQRVIMSLWNVDDEATRLLMTRLITYAAEHPPAEALRLAMVDTRKDYPDPALWASFLMFGSAR